jgi:hypothetical protein
MEIVCPHCGKIIDESGEPEKVVFVRYVGHKAQKRDTVYGTGIVWNGHGDVKKVPESIAQKMAAHKDVWEIVEGEEPAEQVKQSTVTPKRRTARRGRPRKAKEAK